MAGWIEARTKTARRLARRSAERRRIEEALRLGAADLSASDGTTCNVKSIAAENVGQSMNKKLYSRRNIVKYAAKIHCCFSGSE